MGKKWQQRQILFSWSPNSLQTVTAAMIKRCLLLGRKAITNLDSILKSRDITLPTKVYIAKGIVFPVVLYGCGSWTIKKAGCQRTDASELWCWRRLSLDSKEIKPVNPKGNQPWIFIGSWTDAEAEAPILWTLDVKSWLTGKDPDVGKDWRQEGKGMTKDEMVRWHHRLNGRELSKLWESGEGRLMCCSPCGHKDSEVTLWLNNIN